MTMRYSSATNNTSTVKRTPLLVCWLRVREFREMEGLVTHSGVESESGDHSIIYTRKPSLADVRDEEDIVPKLCLCNPVISKSRDGTTTMRHTSRMFCWQI